MLNQLFNSVFDSNTVSISIGNFLLCVGVALVLGVALAVCYTVKNRYTKSFLITLALLPAVVGVVIMLVNGNVGAGVAVAGAFSLVRFRSAQGSAKEIVAIFIAMCAGLMIGMGYIGYAVLFTVIISAIMVALNALHIWDKKHNRNQVKVLRITIPEDLNYTEIFNDVFQEYTEQCDVISVKTTNMGSMFKLKYNIVEKDLAREKEFIDALRCRNGNLEVMICESEDNDLSAL